MCSKVNISNYRRQVETNNFNNIKLQTRILEEVIDNLPRDTRMIYEKLVELILRYKHCYISQSTLGDWFGKYRQSIWRHIKLLKSLGLLKVFFRGHRQTCLYHLPENFFKEKIANFLGNRFTAFRQLLTRNVSLLKNSLSSCRKYIKYGSCKIKQTTKNVDNFSKKEEVKTKLLTRDEISMLAEAFLKKVFAHV